MDRNTIIGFGLIFMLLLAVSYINKPSAEELERQQFVRDSLLTEQVRMDSLAQLEVEQIITDSIEQVLNAPDSVKTIMLSGEYGAFASLASGEESFVELENDLFKLTFTTKGGNISVAQMKNFERFVPGEDGEKGTRVPLTLLDNEKNTFEYILPVPGAAAKKIYTSDLFFQPKVSGKELVMRASIGEGQYVEQVYTIKDGSYEVEYDLRLVGLKNVLDRGSDNIQLHWVDYLNRQEKSSLYEGMYSSAYFKQVDDDPDHCNCRKSDTETSEKPIKWVSHAAQFFNASLIANEQFKAAEIATENLTEEDPALKKLVSNIAIAYDGSTDLNMGMKFYIGPNEYNRLREYDMQLEEIIPFGWSIFGWVNRHIVRRLFNFFAGFLPNYGLVILGLTVLIKLVLYPLTFKMLRSQAKMAALKPQIAKIKERVGDDAQKVQMEQMKLYRETGANPLGGCMPMLLQMPIWIALYRFFPASIEFRQKSFLWADDLSSYDSIITFGDIPLISSVLGNHLSLFTILWAITTVIYTYYNSKHMDFSANPTMKYIQYFMPIMFLFFFNNYASGLTCYLLFSNLFNIGQTIITKQFIINHDKIAQELEDNKKKPKKKNKFQERMESAMKESQALKAKQDMERSKKRKEERQKDRKKK